MNHIAHKNLFRNFVSKKLLPIIFLLSSGFWIITTLSVLAGSLNVSVCIGDSPDCPTTTTTTTTTVPGATTTTTSSGGGGGGGGGLPPITTKVVFSGLAYPSSKIYILKNGVLAVQSIAGPDAKFQVDLINISEGNYNFSIWAEDINSIKSLSYGFSVHITNNVTTTISGILLPPTIDIDKTEVRKGDPVTVFGQTVPSAIINIAVNSTNEIRDKIVAGKDGLYRYLINSTNLDYGNHDVQTNVYVVDEDLESIYNSKFAFIVGTKNVFKTSTTPKKTVCPIKGDINGDCRVNLTDFSILAYWWGKGSDSNILLAMDKKLYADGKIDLRDFSIMAYYWTG